MALLAALACGPAPPAAAVVIGQWDFSQGWNASTGVIAAGPSIPGMTLVSLPKTIYYQDPAAHGYLPVPQNPPQLQFAATGSFGIANLGSGSSTVVMQVPDMRGYGLVTGLMATFPKMANGDGSPTRLNRYSVVMDVYIPGTTDGQRPPNYLTLFQSRLLADGAWFVRKEDDATGVASAYGGAVTPDAWHRLALVMDLSTSGSVSQYRAYVNGTLAADIVPLDVPQTSERNVELVTRDLYTDQDFSIGTLADSYPTLSNTMSGFFLFNADKNDAIDGPTRGELGTLYVANLQFRDDGLTSQQVLALGGPAPGFVPVPEPTGLALAGTAAAAAAALAVRRSRRRFLRDAGISVAGAALASPPLRAAPSATAGRAAAPPPREPLP